MFGQGPLLRTSQPVIALHRSIVIGAHSSSPGLVDVQCTEYMVTSQPSHVRADLRQVDFPHRDYAGPD
jgi:hypothetical protein